MRDSVVPGLNKWPFYVGDLFLLGIAAAVIHAGPTPLQLWQGALAVAAVALGAGVCVLPFLREHQAAVALSETAELSTTVAQIGRLEDLKTYIENATGHWQQVQQQSSQTAQAAKETADRMRAELEQFTAFLRSTQDTEKNHLRLEVEKLRRSERDWLQATVLVLDHIYALHAAGSRSGQPALAAQLGQFQFACREILRRLGLVGFAPAVGDAFEPNAHQLEKEGPAPEKGTPITEILATGYTYQGEMMRRALVRVGE